MSRPLPDLPPLLRPQRLTDLCRETAAVERVEPFALEKDYYLTRLLLAIGQELSRRRFMPLPDLTLPGETGTLPL